MKKYQPEGKYEPMREDIQFLDEVALIKIMPNEMNGKYKIGQNMKHDDRLLLGKNIFERDSKTAKDTLELMGFSMSDNEVKLEKDVEW